MPEVVHVGCVDLPHGVGWDRYFTKLSFVETSVLSRGPARPSVLAKWRAAAPGPGAFGLVAPAITDKPVGLTGGVEPLATAAQSLDASAVVFRTPPSFSPSASNRDLLTRFFAEVAPAETFGGAARVWQPDGLWDVRTALKVAGELGVVLGCDPLVRDQTHDPVDLYATLDVPDVYFRISGLGRGGRRLPAAQVDEVVEITSVYERAWVVFATVDSFSDAVRFQRTIAATIPSSSARDSEEE